LETVLHTTLTFLFEGKTFLMYGTHFTGAPEKGSLLSDLEVGEEKKQVSRTHGIIKGKKK
jgi:hypothetical protein